MSVTFFNCCCCRRWWLKLFSVRTKSTLQPININTITGIIFTLLLLFFFPVAFVVRCARTFFLFLSSSSSSLLCTVSVAIFASHTVPVLSQKRMENFTHFKYISSFLIRCTLIGFHYLHTEKLSCTVIGCYWCYWCCALPPSSSLMFCSN